MPIGVQEAHIDRWLTNVSIAYMQSERDFVASKISDPIPVLKQSDLILTWTKEDWFRDEARLIAPATETPGGSINLDPNKTYFCSEYGFHEDVPIQVEANADPPLSIRLAVAKLVVQKLLIKGDRLLADAIFKAGVWGTDDATKDWSDYGTSVPIIDHEDAKDTIHKTTAKDPQTALYGRETWKKLKHHPDLIERIRYVQRGVITVDLIAALFEIPRVVVAQTIRSTNIEGAASVYAYMYGKHALLMHQLRTPTLMDATAFMSFKWRALGLDARIRRFFLDKTRVNRIEGFMNIDHVVTASDLGYLSASALGLSLT